MAEPLKTKKDTVVPTNIPATTVRIEPEVKKKTATILDEFGSSIVTAVKAFLEALIRGGSVPLEMNVKTK